MRVAIVVNDINTELTGYTTTHLAKTFVNMDHEVWVAGVADFAYDPAGAVCAYVRAAPASYYETAGQYLRALRADNAKRERISFDDMDVLLLRYDPASEVSSRPWAQTSPLLFAQLCKRRGVITLNDPHSLANAINKTYLQHFPEQARPRTLITRDSDEIKKFIAELGGQAVLKPLQGSGGTSVFLVSPDNLNVKQMIDAISRDGYVVCQEYLPAAAKGDLRLFVMNGKPLTADGKHAVFRRISRAGDMRSNVSAGGRVEVAEVTERALRLVELVRPKLIQDGMFLVGLDIADDKLMEVNVFSPGGLNMCQKLHGADFVRAVVEAIERKVSYKRYYAKSIDNVEFATL
jgi:glutathione synthase